MNHAELLQQLNVLQPPAPPGWWPPAPGWWLVTLLLLLLPLVMRGLWRGWQRQRRLRRILAELDRLKQRPDLDDAGFAAAVSILLKRAALARHERQRIAALHGTDWLAFLDASGTGTTFTRGPGRVLAEAPYQARARVDRPALLAAARDWLRRNP